MIFITAQPLAEWEATEPCYNRCRCAPIAMVGALFVLDRLPPSTCHKWLTIIWLIGGLHDNQLGVLLGGVCRVNCLASRQE
jgi:hypothetical protein